MHLKTLVTSTALVIVACTGVPSEDEGADVPPFVEANYPSVPASGSADTTDLQAEPGAGTSAQATPDGAGSNEPSASNTEPTNEGQNADNLPVANNGADPDAPSNAAPSDTGGQASNDMGAGNGQNPGGMQTGGGEMTTNTQPPPPPAPPAPPPPRVYPPLDCSAPAPALANGTEACRVNASGSVDGQSWFMWYSGSNGCMTTYDTAAFRANWNNSGDFLARMGLQFDETKTFDQYGTIGADIRFNRSGSGGGYSFIGVYGWSNNPLIEYYIVEDSFGNGPATPYATTQRGTFNVDGATYRIYSGTKNNQPSIHGTANFQQFFSVRQTPRQCGHVSISEHFRQWASMGMNMGKLYEARVLVEAGGGSGNINFTTARVTTTEN